MITYEEKVIKRIGAVESYIHERFFYDDTVLQKSADEGATAHSGESTKGTNRDDSYDGAND